MVIYSDSADEVDLFLYVSGGQKVIYIMNEIYACRVDSDVGQSYTRAGALFPSFRPSLGRYPGSSGCPYI